MNRAFDVVTSFSGLMVTLPFYAAVWVAIRLSSPGPCFYRQERVGLNGRPFTILKFRTMVVDSDRGRPITTKGDDRITRVGRWLRRFKLDELPTLWNVLRGDMSLVGPRPELPRYVSRYTAEQRRVLSVRPGITDPATLRFDDESDLLTDADFEETYVTCVLPEKLQLNLEYLDRRSFLSDLRMIFSTLFLMAKRKGT